MLSLVRLSGFSNSVVFRCAVIGMFGLLTVSPAQSQSAWQLGQDETTAKLTWPFGGDPTQSCDGCMALITTNEPAASSDTVTEIEPVNEALSARGFEVTQRSVGTIIELENSVTEFLQKARQTSAKSIVVWLDQPVTEHDGLSSVTVALPRDRSPTVTGLGALPIEGLLDQVRETGARSAMLIVNGVVEKPGYLEPFDLSVQTQLLFLGRKDELARSREGLVDSVATLLRTGASDADFDDAINLGELEAVFNLKAHILVADIDEPNQVISNPKPLPSIDLSALTFSVDLGRAYSQRLRSLWAPISRRDSIRDVRQFIEKHCRGASLDPLCSDAQVRLQTLRNEVPESVRDCNRLATDPNDPDAIDPGVPLDRMLRNREPQSVCRMAMADTPNDPRMIYQFGRALERRDNPSYENQYRRAAEMGYRIAEFAYGLDQFRQNPRSALAWIRRAADKGLVEAQLAAAELLESDAYGVRADIAAARKYYEMAARQSPRGKANLAAFLLVGAPSASDRDRARALFGQALRGGLPDYMERGVRERLSQLGPSENRNDGSAISSACAAVLDFDPLKLFGVLHVRDLGGQTQHLIENAIAERVLGIDFSSVVNACYGRVENTDARTDLVTAYAFTLWWLELTDQNHGQDRYAWRDLFQGAAENQDPSAMFFVAALSIGLGANVTGEQLRSAIEWLNAAHTRGVDEAALFLALIHLSPDMPLDFSRDPERGVKYLNAIADRPYPIVKLMMARSYLEPRKFGLPADFKDEALGEKYLDEAAKLGVNMKGM